MFRARPGSARRHRKAIDTGPPLRGSRDSRAARGDREPLRAVLASVLLAAGACGLNAAGLGSADDGGAERPRWEADGFVEADVEPDADAEPEVDVAPAADVDAPVETDVEPAGEADIAPEVNVEPDGEAGAAPDGGPEDEGEAETPLVCDPGGLDDICSAGVVRRCRPDGGGFDEIWCDFGCTGSGASARCFDLDVPNVSDDSLLRAGTALFLAPAARVVLFDTDTGAIRAWDSLGAELAPVRAAGEGNIDGIGFAVESQGGGAPDLGIWSFGEFHVPADLDVVGKGSRAMVVLSAGEVRIRGRVLVGGSAAVLAGATWVGHDEAGPGGSPGGSAETRGDGAGGGGGGSEGSWAVDSGGGGGGYGGVGGTGGEASGHGGGHQGPTYGSLDLVPLLGGSGGGGGGDDDGGRGGHGGGALEIVGAAGIWIEAGGGINAGGGGGLGGRGSGAGGGGGSGGAVLLVGPRIDIMGGVAANGGGGGSGAYSTSTGGRNGQNGQLATTPAAGGAGGGEGTAGGYGSDFDTLAGGNGESDPNDDDSGGGGGGAGRIRLDGLVIGVGGFLSPDETYSGTPRGTLHLY